MTPLVLILLVVTMIVWMTQVLQRVEIIVDHGQGLGIFAMISVLIIPSLLAVIIPFGVFGAVAYALYRLHSDSEIAVIFAAGVSRLRIARPILLLTAIGALATLYVNVDLMPRSYRLLKMTIADIRADVASSVLKSGEFTTFIDGFTVYVDESRPGGQFVGLLVNDYRDSDDPRVYMAERALLQETENGPMLFLRNGMVQRGDPLSDNLSFIPFEEVSVNVSEQQGNRDEFFLEVTERYPHELLNPDMSHPYDQRFAGKLIAEGHARYAAPIYTFAYVLICLYALIGGAYSRQGYVLRLCAAGAAIFGIRVAGFVLQGIVEGTGAYWQLYAVPLVPGLIVAFFLFANISLPSLNASGRSELAES